MKVKMSKNIENFKPKLIGSFTTRQVVSSVICLCVNIPLYIFLEKYIGEDIAGWVVIILAIPILAFGWMEYQGLTFEKFIFEIVISEFFAPKVRPYQIEDEMEEFLKNDFSEEKGKRKDRI